MLANITFDKVEEIIRLAERARDAPDERADDPRRGGVFGSDGVSRPASPPEPQPAPNWRSAFERYLKDLPNEALGEVIGLYRYGHSDVKTIQEALSRSLNDGAAPADRVVFITSRTDLPRCLRAALERM